MQACRVLRQRSQLTSSLVCSSKVQLAESFKPAQPAHVVAGLFVQGASLPESFASASSSRRRCWFACPRCKLAESFASAASSRRRWVVRLVALAESFASAASSRRRWFVRLAWEFAESFVSEPAHGRRWFVCPMVLAESFASAASSRRRWFVCPRCKLAESFASCSQLTSSLVCLSQWCKLAESFASAASSRRRWFVCLKVQACLVLRQRSQLTSSLVCLSKVHACRVLLQRSQLIAVAGLSVQGVRLPSPLRQRSQLTSPLVCLSKVQACRVLRQRSQLTSSLVCSSKVQLAESFARRSFALTSSLVSCSSKVHACLSPSPAQPAHVVAGLSVQGACLPESFASAASSRRRWVVCPRCKLAESFFTRSQLTSSLVCLRPVQACRVLAERSQLTSLLVCSFKVQACRVLRQRSQLTSSLVCRVQGASLPESFASAASSRRRWCRVCFKVQARRVLRQRSQLTSSLVCLSKVQACLSPSPAQPAHVVAGLFVQGASLPESFASAASSRRRWFVCPRCKLAGVLPRAPPEPAEAARAGGIWLEVVCNSCIFSASRTRSWTPFRRAQFHANSAQGLELPAIVRSS